MELGLQNVSSPQKMAEEAVRDEGTEPDANRTDQTESRVRRQIGLKAVGKCRQRGEQCAETNRNIEARYLSKECAGKTPGRSDTQDHALYSKEVFQQVCAKPGKKNADPGGVEVVEGLSADVLGA